MKNILTINFNPKRVYGLDILRAVAIIFVIFAHGAKILPTSTYRFHDYFLLDGVFLFFVLSGYLIGGILIKILENNKATGKNLRNFWVRRWFRTIPTYFLILSILIAIRFLFYGGMQGTSIIHYFFFVQNFSYPHPVFYSEAWTLSVEEWFYLLIPSLVFILVGVFKIIPKRAILMIACSVIVASVAFRLHRYIDHPITSVTDWDMHFRKEVITRLDSLMFGVLGAWCVYYHKALWTRHKTKLFFIGLALVIFEHFASLYASGALHVTQTGYGIYLSVFSFPIMAFGTLLLLPLLSEIKSGSGYTYKALTYISIVSYSMYLIHVSLIQPFVFNITGSRMTPLLVFLRYSLYWILTIVCSILLYNYFEKPTTNIREKLVRKQ